MKPTVRLCLLLAALTLLQCVQLVVTRPARAQFGGILVEMYRMIQFGPGSQVLMLDVSGQTLRFGVHDLESRNSQFSFSRFMSETRRRKPSLYIKGPAHILEMLCKEEPEKRMLRLTGLYYQDSRNFVLSRVQPVRQTQQEQPF